MRIPVLTELPSSKEMTEEFKGYNHNLRIGTGEWYEEKNMTTDYYPLASVRNKRSLQQEVGDFVIQSKSGSAPKIEVKKSHSAVYTDGRLITLRGLYENGEPAGCVFVDNEEVVARNHITVKKTLQTTVTVNTPDTTDNFTFSGVTASDINAHLGDVFNIRYEDSDIQIYPATVIAINLSSIVMDTRFHFPATHFEGQHTVTFVNNSVVSEVSALFKHTEDLRTITRMGSYIFCSPDGVVYESANTTDDVPLFKVNESAELSGVTFRTVIENTDGDNEYTPITVGNSYRYSEGNVQYYITDDALWVNQPTYLFVYKRNNTGTFNGFSEGDAIKLTKSGAISVGSTAVYKDGIFDKDTNEANVVILKKGTLASGTNIDNNITTDTDYILVRGFVYTKTESSSDYYFACTVTTTDVVRKMPDIKFACESQNRIWCCDKAGHEIYASALGNPYNFYDYSGLSTDSYAVNVGTEGEWTGCVNYLGQPLFFKENAVHIISGSYPTNQGQLDGGSYAVTTVTDFKGVEKGSERSFAVIDNILYYKSAEGIVAYDGSATTIISTALGKTRYKNAVAGCRGNKYYVSMQDESNAWHLFVYDTKLGTWSKEDNTHALQFVKINNELLYYDVDDGNVYSVTDTDVLTKTEYEVEGDFDWMCETGTIGYSLPNNKYISRFQVRMQVEDGARVSIFTQYDSDGVWHKVGDIENKGIKTHLLPIVPRRCDHIKIKFEGRGDAKIISIAKIIEEGGDVV